MLIRFAVLATLSLAGCQTVHDLVGVDGSPRASETGAYDGSYQGDIRQVVARSKLCPAEHGERVFSIGDGTLWYAYTPDIVFTAPIQRDGSIEGIAGPTSLRGRIVGNHLSARVQGPDCAATISADYLYNH